MPLSMTIGLAILEVNPPGPVQANVAPIEVEVPMIGTEVIIQVNVLPTALAFGVALSWLMVIEAVDVHPLSEVATTL